jgi:energy-converting hydrogenase Eha subunit B
MNNEPVMRIGEYQMDQIIQEITVQILQILVGLEKVWIVVFIKQTAGLIDKPGLKGHAGDEVGGVAGSKGDALNNAVVHR